MISSYKRVPSWELGQKNARCGRCGDERENVAQRRGQLGADAQPLPCSADSQVHQESSLRGMLQRHPPVTPLSLLLVNQVRK